MTPGTGLGNQVTMLPKYHTVRVPRLGHPYLEFTYDLFTHLFWGLTELLLRGLVCLYRAVAAKRD